jgi:hypothetical protein
LGGDLHWRYGNAARQDRVGARVVASRVPGSPRCSAYRVGGAVAGCSLFVGAFLGACAASSVFRVSGSPLRGEGGALPPSPPWFQLYTGVESALRRCRADCRCSFRAASPVAWLLCAPECAAPKALLSSPNGGRSAAGAAAPQGTRQTPAHASHQGGIEGGRSHPPPRSGVPKTRKTLSAAHAPRISSIPSIVVRTATRSGYQHGGHL